jgi:lipopolysaccharide transport system permease protein
MGSSELRRRYVRSRIGQLWLTVSTAITVVTLGLIWSLLWKIPVAEMLPFFAIGQITWIYIATFFTDATTVFVNNGSYYLNQKMSFSTAIYALAYRNLITLAHNLVIVVAVMLLFAVPVSYGIIVSFGGLMLTTSAGIAAAYIIAMFCARYRDMIQIVSNVMQVAYFISPVLWKEELIPSERRWIVEYNPFAVFVSIVRDPLIGIHVTMERWLYGVGVTVGVVVLCLVLVGRLRPRIIYWL